MVHSVIRGRWQKRMKAVNLATHFSKSLLSAAKVRFSNFISSHEKPHLQILFKKALICQYKHQTEIVLSIMTVYCTAL